MACLQPKVWAEPGGQRGSLNKQEKRFFFFSYLIQSHIMKHFILIVISVLLCF